MTAKFLVKSVTDTHHGLITIANDGPLIKHTNYWDSPYSHSGYAFLTWNAGTARLLLPDALKPGLRDMAAAKCVVISRGPLGDAGGRDAFEILFEDFSDAPYALTMSFEQTDGVPLEAALEGFTLTVWTRGGLKQRYPAKFRLVNQLPCMAPWGSI